MILLIVSLALVSMFIFLLMPVVKLPKKIESETKEWELKKGTTQWEIYKGTKLYELELWWDKDHLDYMSFYDKYGFYPTPPRKVEKDYPRLLRGASNHFHISMDSGSVSFIPKDSADFSRVMILGPSARLIEINNEIEQTEGKLKEIKNQVPDSEFFRDSTDKIWDSISQFQKEIEELEKERAEIAETMLDGLKKKDLIWNS